MKTNHFLFPVYLVIIQLIALNFSSKAQNELYHLSYEANSSRYSDLSCQYFYKIQKVGEKYQLTDDESSLILNESYDTILWNNHFIKLVDKDSISIYRARNLQKVKIENLKQVYFLRNGLEALTSNGPQLYNNRLERIEAFPEINDALGCGSVYKKKYRITFNDETKKYYLSFSEGYYGLEMDEKLLELTGIPEQVDIVCFFNGRNYTTESINSTYFSYPEFVKVTKDGKSGIYSYDFKDAVYPPVLKDEKNKIVPYEIDKLTGDTIFQVNPVKPVPSSFIEKGSIQLKEVLPINCDSIQQNTSNGLVYLNKNGKIGFYPQHIDIEFERFEEVTKSFYKIKKEGNDGWIDITTFKEYYFEK